MQLSERIGRRLKLRDLNIFLIVAKERSMSKAATQLAVAQPAISKAIADIEYTLGAPLFDRGSRGVEPTLYGRALIRRSVAIFDELRQSVKDIESLLDPAVGETSIGSNGLLAAGFVSAVVKRLTRRHPRASVQVMDAVLDRLLRELRDRNIDLAIGTSIAPISDEDMELELLFRDRLVIVAGVSSKWAGRRKIRPADTRGALSTWRAVDVSAGRKHTRHEHCQRFPVRWPFVSPPNRPYRFDLRNHSLASRRALPHCASGIYDTLHSQKPAAQSVAGRIACSAVTGRDRYDEELHP